MLWIFVISLVFKKICKQLGYLTMEKVSLQNLKPTFPVISRIFDFEYHGQTSLKVALMFGLVFMKFRKLKSLHRENKKLDLYKT